MDFLDAQKTHTMSKYREFAYKKEADPLFLKWQRDEIDKQEWVDKVQEIKNRYPYPDGCTLSEAQKIIDNALNAEQQDGN